MKRLYVIAYAALGEGLSGGDNILIELSKRWADKLDITIKGGSQIFDAAIKKNLRHTQVKFDICPSYLKFGRYIERLFWALRTAFKFNGKDCIVYTASDFWHDSLVGWIIKLRFPSVKWIAGYYLVAPHPFAKDNPYRKKGKWIV